VKHLFRLILHRTAVSVILCASLFGCYPAPKVPIDTVRYEAGDRSNPRLLFVYLPGRGDPVSAFRDEGLLEALREQGLNADVIAADAHLGYYLDWSIITRLNDDIIAPARATGKYDQIWFIGNSLGGFGSLSYAREHPDHVTGIILLGPYVGEKKMIQEIRQAGGLLNWEPGAFLPRTLEASENLLWLWIRDKVLQNRSGAAADSCAQGSICVPRIYLGYGVYDRFSAGQEFLGTVLPPGHVIVQKGGHDWPTWKKAFKQLLEQDLVKP